MHNMHAIWSACVTSCVRILCARVTSSSDLPISPCEHTYLLTLILYYYWKKPMGKLQRRSFVFRRLQFVNHLSRAAHHRSYAQYYYACVSPPPSIITHGNVPQARFCQTNPLKPWAHYTIIYLLLCATTVLTVSLCRHILNYISRRVYIFVISKSVTWDCCTNTDSNIITKLDGTPSTKNRTYRRGRQPIEYWKVLTWNKQKQK